MNMMVALKGKKNSNKTKDGMSSKVAATAANTEKKRRRGNDSPEASQKKLKA